MCFAVLRQWACTYFVHVQGSLWNYWFAQMPSRIFEMFGIVLFCLIDWFCRSIIREWLHAALSLPFSSTISAFFVHDFAKFFLIFENGEKTAPEKGEFLRVKEMLQHKIQSYNGKRSASKNATEICHKRRVEQMVIRPAHDSTGRRPDDPASYPRQNPTYRLPIWLIKQKTVSTAQCYSKKIKTTPV